MVIGLGGGGLVRILYRLLYVNEMFRKPLASEDDRSHQAALFAIKCLS